MGVVYEAQDSHLDRAVALKLLPHDAMANPSRKQRFVQEAKAASALNHPHIVTIYDIDSDDGVDYIAMELIRGRTLEQALSRGKLRLADALKYGVQIADALAAAHAAGIVHRDLKPGNVMITERGDVKVLDFGLAKLTDDTEISEVDETRTQRAMTEEGSVVGSAPYMSPEQAEGRKVDARSDIFSFGSLMYEMLTGQRAFRGANRMATMASILKEEPAAISKFVPDMPREVERVVARCLRKDLDRRSQSMAEIRVALQDLKDESESGSLVSAQATVPVRRRSRWPYYAAALAAAALTAIAGTWWGLRRDHGPAPRIVPFTSSGAASDPAFSPDGSLLAFSAAGPDRENYDIYVQQIGVSAPVRLTTDPANDRAPVFSPDGRYVAFVRQGGNIGTLILIPALGGPERKLGPANSRGIDFSPDGKTIAVSSGFSDGSRSGLGIFLVSVDSGSRKQVTSPGSDYDYQPRFSPDGRSIAFDRGGVPLSSGLRRFHRRRRGQGPRWRESGVHFRFGLEAGWTGDCLCGAARNAGAVWVVGLSGGTPQPLSLVGENANSVAISRAGNRMAYVRPAVERSIWRMNLRETPDGPAGRQVKLISSTRLQGEARYSPDGKRVAFASDRSGSQEIWVANADGSNPVQLTSLAGHCGSPRWSPDSRRLVFDFNGHEKSKIYVIDADGGTPKRLSSGSAGDVGDTLASWSSNGRWIYFARRGYIWRIAAEGGTETQLTRRSDDASNPKESPDGKTLYFYRARTVWRISPDGGAESPVDGLPEIASIHAWQPVDDGIYFLERVGTSVASAEYRVEFFDFASRKATVVGDTEKPYHPDGFSVSPDRQYVLLTEVDRNDQDIMLVENFR